MAEENAPGEKPPPEFMSALVTEHFVLQGTSSSTISESGSRVSIYLSALSSGLVAIGFASPYFDTDDSVAGNHGVRYGRWSFLFTMASMVIMVNSVVAGATVALLFALAIRAASPVPVVIGIVVGLALLAWPCTTSTGG